MTDMWLRKDGTPIIPSSFNVEAAEALIGKTVLIGRTYQKPDGEIVKRTQQHGVIVRVHKVKGVGVELKQTKDIFWLPPDIKGLKPAKPGIYISKSTGEDIENPDFLSYWIVEV